jgi:hypothetical protein
MPLCCHNGTAEGSLWCEAGRLLGARLLLCGGGGYAEVQAARAVGGSGAGRAGSSSLLWMAARQEAGAGLRWCAKDLAKDPS